MPSGIELVLGFPRIAFPRFTEATGVQLPLECIDQGEEVDIHDLGEENPQLAEWITTANERLGIAHRDALLEMGFTPATHPLPRRLDRSFYMETPLGVRAFYPFKIAYMFDPVEMGERPEDAVLGVTISGRYFPTFADWKDEHGTLSPMVFDDELQHVQAIAQKHIIAAIPAFARAVWIVKERWY